MAFIIFAIYLLLGIYIHVFWTYFYKQQILCKSIFSSHETSKLKQPYLWKNSLIYSKHNNIIIIYAIFSAGLVFLLLVDILEKGVYREKSSEWLFVQSSHLFSVINLVAFFANSALQKQLCHYVTALASCHSSRLVEHLR